MKEARYFFVPDAESSTELPAEEAMHALRVLRLKSGDDMFLMDGNGNFFKAKVTLAATKHCMYEITEKMPQEKTWNGNICIAVAPTKMMDRIEWFAEKATEVGIDELAFLNCQFSERKVLKTLRLDKIIISAVKQSRKPYRPQLTPLTRFNDFIKKERAGLKFIAHCYEEIPSVDFFDTASKEKEQASSDGITVLIGPEGDFSIDEVREAMKYGFTPISLGKSRLRTETAALYAAMYAQLICRKD